MTDVAAAPERNRRTRLPKASDILADELRAEILERNLAPGTPLPSEAELIETHQFSRGTVREALRLLEVEGFIDIRRGRSGGINVRRPDVNLVSRSLATLLVLSDTPLIQLFEFRKLIEPAVAAAAAVEATDEQRQVLMDFATEGEEGGGAPFHVLLGESTTNEFHRIILAVINKVVTWHTDLEQITGHDVDEARRAHVRVAQAIADGDAEQASRLMLRHVGAYEKVMRQQGRLDAPVLPRDRWIRHLRRNRDSA